MRALVIDKGGGLRLASDWPEPRRAPGEAVVRTRLAGICDTDLQLQRGYMGFDGVPGHECVGEVVESDDTAWRGKRVVADINAGCGVCADCVDRDGHHCAQRSVLGILSRDGAFAERFVVPERCLVEVPAEVSDAHAVFAEPLAAAAHVLDEVEPGDRVVVLGDGKLGLLISLVLVQSGADVTVIGHHRSKLELAVGATQMLESELDETTRDADVVVEVTGSAAGVSRALSLVRPRGTILLKTTVADRSEIDLAPVVIDELRVVGSRCGDMTQAVELLSTGAVDPTPLVSDRYALDDGVAAFERAQTPGVLKVLLDPTY